MKYDIDNYFTAATAINDNSKGDNSSYHTRKV